MRLNAEEGCYLTRAKPVRLGAQEAMGALFQRGDGSLGFGSKLLGHAGLT